MEEKRRMALDAMTAEKIGDEKADSLARISDLMTKNIQLLAGNATERREVDLSIVDDNVLAKLADVGAENGSGEDGACGDGAQGIEPTASPAVGETELRDVPGELASPSDSGEAGSR